LSEIFDDNEDLINLIVGYEPEKIIFIVSCTKEKIWDNNDDLPVYISAEKAYTGKKFKRFLEWYHKNNFKKLGYNWIILSGKYGFIEPDHPISWYDINLSDPNHYPISKKSLQNQVNQLRMWKRDTSNLSYQIQLQDFETIVCINCSKKYLKIIKKCFKNNTYIIVKDINKLESI